MELEEKILRYKLSLKDRPKLEWSWQEVPNRGVECTILAHIETGSSTFNIQNKRNLRWKAMELIPGMNNETEFAAPAHSLLMKADLMNSSRLESKNHATSMQASPQATRKKHFMKLDISSTGTARTDGNALARDKTTRQVLRKRLNAKTAILVDKSTAPLVKDHRTLSVGRAQYITLQAPEGGLLTIVNIYAPLSSNDRAPFWRKLSQVDLASGDVIVEGDFNHAEGKLQEDVKESLYLRQRESWTALFHLKTGQIMVSQEITKRGGRIESATSVRKLSNHSPLVMTVWGNHPPLENLPHYFDISLLAEEELRKEMVAAWKGDQESPPNNQGWPAWLEVDGNPTCHKLQRATRKGQEASARQTR
ncbi:unnamed protein product [Sphagnum jensenii]|uniref:Endonuclease/exonuclease/phosphatase domain-containing protein n=1 Tax=Sphagnum jensenii TaxID=128206 RepID=A0ABP1B3F4_9BRYO